MTAPHPRWPGLLVEVSSWWAVAVVVWLVTLSAFDGQDLVVAIACGLPCGVAAAAGRRAIGGAWTFRAGWLRPVVLAPVAILVQTIAVLALPVRAGRRSRGRVRTVELGSPGRPAGLAAGHAVLAAVLVSIAPGSFALDLEPGTGELRMHALDVPGPRLEERLGP